MTDLLFQMLRNGIEELRTEKYQQEKNGQAEALQITLNNLQGKVKKLNIDDVSKPKSDEKKEAYNKFILMRKHKQRWNRF